MAARKTTKGAKKAQGKATKTAATKKVATKKAKPSKKRSVSSSTSGTGLRIKRVKRLKAHDAKQWKNYSHAEYAVFVGEKQVGSIRTTKAKILQRKGVEWAVFQGAKRIKVFPRDPEVGRAAGYQAARAFAIKHFAKKAG